MSERFRRRAAALRTAARRPFPTPKTSLPWAQIRQTVPCGPSGEPTAKRTPRIRCRIFSALRASASLRVSGATIARRLCTIACFYRYANVDVGQLRENLKGDEDLVGRTLEAFVRASVAAIPTGKQNSMAAQNPPSRVVGKMIWEGQAVRL